MCLSLMTYKKKDRETVKKITTTHSGRGRLKQLPPLIDGSQAFRSDAPAVAGKPVTLKELRTVLENEPSGPETHQHCLNAAIRFLRYRPRSEFEVRERLRHRGYDSQSIDATMATLKEKGLIDDQAFARFWADNRDAFSPRSQRLVKIELRRKGIAGDIIDQIVAPSDDMEGVYRAAQKKARSLPRTDYQSFRRRLGDYLRRRGFGYGVIEKVVQQAWQEGTAITAAYQSSSPDKDL
jgi:regulatory protein